MLIFDRIVLVVLALGVWALVLAPQEIGAHHKDAGHSCDVGGSAHGQLESYGNVEIDDVADLYVDCTHT